MQADTSVQYGAVKTKVDGVAECIVGGFRTEAAAAAYAGKQGWADFMVAPYRTRLLWE
jgi:hypothetical protein